MSKVIIGSARHDENNKYVGGAKGDQTTHEVETQDFYVHSKGWYVLRAKDSAVAKKLAEAMQIACANENIGYNQDDRDGIISVGINTKTKCNCDCSSLVRACIIYAAGKDVGDFYTGNEAYTLERSGLFEKRVAYEDGYALAAGDVLVTQKKGHTVIVTEAAKETSTARSTLRQGNTGEDVDTLQRYLNYFGYRDSTGRQLEVDGDFGSKTLAALKRAQTDLKAKGYYSDTIDGICGPNTWKAIDKLMKIGYTAVADTDVNCRDYSIVQSLGKVLKVIPKGTEIYITNYNGKWQYVPSIGGYVSGNCTYRKST